MEIFKLFGSVLVDNEKANASISKTEEKAGGLAAKFGAGMKTAAKWGAAIAGAAIAVGGAMLGMASKSAKAMDEVHKGSQRMGISAKAYQELDYWAGQNGISHEDVEKAVGRLNQRMGEAAKGNKKYSDALQELGVDMDGVRAGTVSTEEAFATSIQSLSQMTNEQEKAALASELFGTKLARELLPALNDGSMSIEEATAMAEKMGIVMDEDAVIAGAAFTDALDNAKRSLGAIGTSIGAELMPMFTRLFDWIVEHLPQIKEAIGVAVEKIKEIIAGFKEFWEENGEAITSVLSAVFETAKTIIKTAMDIIKGIIDVVMGIIQGDWEKAWGGLKGILEGVFKLIGQALQIALDALIAIITGIGKAAKAAGKAMFQAVWDGMKDIWTSLSTWVSDKVAWLIDKLTFWRRSEQEMSSGSNKKSDGKRASGLAYVPFDGYRAELHRGEEVVSLQDKQSISAQITNALSAIMDKPQQSGTINLSVNLNGKTIAQETYSDFINEGKRRGSLVGV